MTTPSLRDAQVAKLIKENERLREALECCVEAMLDHNYYDELKRDCAWHFGDDALPKARAALAEEQGE